MSALGKSPNRHRILQPVLLFASGGFASQTYMCRRVSSQDGAGVLGDTVNKRKCSTLHRLATPLPKRILPLLLELA